MSDTEIERAIQLEDKIIHIHIRLTEDEIRRLLLPHVAQAFASELRRQTYRPQVISGSTTFPIQIDPTLPDDTIKMGDAMLTNIKEE